MARKRPTVAQSLRLMPPKSAAVILAGSSASPALDSCPGERMRRNAEGEDRIDPVRDVVECAGEGVVTTSLARAMVTQYGMTEVLGAIKLGDSNGEPFLGRDIGAFELSVYQVTRAIPPGETLTYEERKEAAADVSARTYLTTRGPYLDASGEAVGVFGVSRDITERKRAEEELKESEARYRALMEHSVEAIYVYDAQTKRVLESNAAFQELIGHTAQELVGMEIYDFIAHDPEDIDGRISRTLEVGGRQIGERNYRKKDGSMVVVQTSSSIMPYGGKTAICAVSRDVTELKGARELLEASERRFRSLIQNAPDAISVLDADSTILYDSPAIARLLGYTPEERIGKRGIDYVHPGDRETAQRTFSEVLQNPGVRLPVEYRIRHKDGSWRHIEAARTNLLSDPAVGGIVLNYRDITERKRAEEELRQSDERHRRRAWELVLLHRVRSAISAETTDLQVTLRKTVEAVAETYGYTLVSAYLIRGDGGELVLQHHVGYDSQLERIPLSRGVMARVARTGKPVLLEDAHSDPEFLEAVPGIVSEVSAMLVAWSPMRSMFFATKSRCVAAVMLRGSSIMKVSISRKMPL